MPAKQHTDGQSDASTCSPSSDGDETTCVLSRDKNGKLGILSAPPIFLCTRESVEDMIARHNEMMDERDKWKSECKRQWLHLSQAGHNARAIQNIRWGYEGDCGAARLANLIEEDCDRGMMSPENVTTLATADTQLTKHNESSK